MSLNTNQRIISDEYEGRETTRRAWTKGQRTWELFITNMMYRASVCASSTESRSRCHGRVRSWVTTSSVFVHIDGSPVSKETRWQDD